MMKNITQLTYNHEVSSNKKSSEESIIYYNSRALTGAKILNFWDKKQRWN